MDERPDLPVPVDRSELLAKFDRADEQLQTMIEGWTWLRAELEVRRAEVAEMPEKADLPASTVQAAAEVFGRINQSFDYERTIDDARAPSEN